MDINNRISYCLIPVQHRYGTGVERNKHEVINISNRILHSFITYSQPGSRGRVRGITALGEEGSNTLQSVSRADWVKMSGSRRHTEWITAKGAARRRWRHTPQYPAPDIIIYHEYFFLSNAEENFASDNMKEGGKLCRELKWNIQGVRAVFSYIVRLHKTW